jgi:hypothetical protein
MYDFAAAANLSSLLAQLNGKLDALATLRATQRSSRLGDPAVPQPTTWTGEKRTEYEDSYRSQQSGLAQLAQRALTVKARVDQATGQAHQARSIGTTGTAR